MISFVATDGKNGQRLKLENVRLRDRKVTRNLEVRAWAKFLSNNFDHDPRLVRGSFPHRMRPTKRTTTKKSGAEKQNKREGENANGKRRREVYLLPTHACRPENRSASSLGILKKKVQGD